jgi:hypothetical protein
MILDFLEREDIHVIFKVTTIESCQLIAMNLGDEEIPKFLPISHA